jgi:tetratricopeptide (TPR) repeat protein
MYKRIGFLLLLVLPLFVSVTVIADSNCNFSYSNYDRAVQFHQLKDYDQALIYYDCALEQESDKSIVYQSIDALNRDMSDSVHAPKSKNALPQLDDESVDEAFLSPSSEAEATSPTADILREAAHEFFGATEFELAIKQYEALLAFEPNNVSAHFGIGYAYYSLENPTQAVVYLQQALDLQPDHLYAQYLLAMSYSMLDMPDEAHALMSAIYGKDQYNGEYPLALGHVFRNLGYMEAAGFEFYSWLQNNESVRLQVKLPVNGKKMPLVMDNGVVYEVPFHGIAGKTVNISVESHLLNVEPIDPLIVILNSSGMAVSGDDDSGANFDSALLFTPTVSDNYTLLISHAGGKTQGELTLTITGTSWTANTYRSHAHFVIDHDLFRVGAALLDKAIELDGGYYHDYMLRAYAKSQMDKLPSAIEDYYFALETSPYPEEVHALIGQTHRTMGDMDSALIAYSRALDINPLLHAVRCEVGMIYASQGEYTSAVQQFDYILGHNMIDSCAWSNRDATLQIMRELDTPSLSPAMELVQVGQQDQTTQDYVAIGDSHRMQENWELASTAYTNALDLDPTLNDVRCQLGLIYVTLRDYPSAIEQFDILLAQNITDFCAMESRRATIRLMNEASM